MYGNSLFLFCLISNSLLCSVRIYQQPLNCGTLFVHACEVEIVTQERVTWSKRSQTAQLREAEPTRI